MLEFRKTVKADYPDVITSDAIAALEALAPFDLKRKALMSARIKRRTDRARQRQRIGFLDPDSTIGGTSIKVSDARAGNFTGSDIPRDLRRQWIQGTGPAARPGASVEVGIRNVAYALLSGADGWMFDGEDALGQVSTMSLDNQRNLKLAIHHDPQFLAVAEQVAAEMNKWAEGFFGRPIIADWQAAAWLSRPRSSARAAFISTTATSGTRTARASRHRSSMRRSTSSTTIAA